MKSNAHNVATIKNDNRALILNLIRKSPVSRADISKITGLSKSSVTMITNSLISEGQIKEIGRDKSSVGRKPILLDIVADFKYAAGIILHRREVTVCLTDLKYEVFAIRSRNINEFSSGEEILNYTSDTVLKLIEENDLPIEKCIGIGISSPGPLDREAGVILSPPRLDVLKNLAVVDGVRERTAMKNILLENNAVVLAMREKVMKYGKNMHNFMSVIISHGIGSAIVTDGEIYRGAAGFSGELGHISVVAQGVKCSCGNSGCLEKYASLDAVKEKFGFPHYSEIVDKAYLGDEKSINILKYIVDHLGSGLVTAVNMFDLDAVLLHGDYSYRPEMINDMLQDYVNQKSFVAAAHNVVISVLSDRLEKSHGNSTAAIIEQYFDQMLEE